MYSVNTNQGKALKALVESRGVDGEELFGKVGIPNIKFRWFLKGNFKLSGKEIAAAMELLGGEAPAETAPSEPPGEPSDEALSEPMAEPPLEVEQPTGLVDEPSPEPSTSEDDFDNLLEQYLKSKGLNSVLDLPCLLQKG